MGSNIFHCFSLLTRFLTTIVVISETSNDDSPKNPQEDKEKPITRSLTCAIPDDVLETCVAKVPRFQYPALSCVSKFFRNLLASPKLYKLRLLLNTTEPVLYAFVGFPFSVKQRWYMLHRIPHQNQVRLCILPSLPPMPLGSALVTIGYNMYIIGGWDDDDDDRVAARVFIIDCTTHKRRQLQSMNRARYRAAAGVVDNKIYVVGGCEMGAGWVEVFDVEKQVWSLVPGPYYELADASEEFMTYVVMKEKLYIFGYDSCFSYEPNNANWELCEKLREYWQGCSCVVDDMLYTFDIVGNHLIVYDPEKKDWRAVHVRVTCGRSWPTLSYYRSKMANMNGWLAILGCDQAVYSEGEKHLWCVMIRLERGERGEIRGTVEILQRVLTSHLLPFVEYCPVVTV